MRSVFHLLSIYRNVLFYLNACTVALFVFIFRHLQLELLTQFPTSNGEKCVYLNVCIFMKISHLPNCHCLINSLHSKLSNFMFLSLEVVSR